MFTMQNEKVRIKIIKVYLNRSGYSFFSRVANVGSTTVRLELWFVHFACIPFGNIRAVSRLIFFALIQHKDTKHENGSKQQPDTAHINGLSLKGD